jgi:hypothetical protein
MNFQYPLARLAACLLLATAGVHAHAQLPAQAAAADPQASVPATRYQSALDYRAPAAPAGSPDRNWVAGNEKVAATNSMALTMKPMGGHAGHGAAEGEQPQAADPHAGHAMPPATAISMHAGQAQHDHAAMRGMSMKPENSPAMCMPGSGKMPCCENCPCMDKMKQNKETP